MGEEKEYEGPERRKVWFDCDNCPQHGRNDQRIQALEEKVPRVDSRVQDLSKKMDKAFFELDKKHDTDIDSVKDRIDAKDLAVWKEIDLMKERSSNHHDGLNRRIGEKVPIKHAIAAITIVIAVFGWMLKVNNDANKRVAEATAATGAKLEEKIDRLTSEVTTMKAVAEAREGSSDASRSLVLEISRMNDAMIRVMDRVSDRIDTLEKRDPPSMRESGGGS